MLRLERSRQITHRPIVLLCQESFQNDLWTSLQNRCASPAHLSRTKPFASTRQLTNPHRTGNTNAKTLRYRANRLTLFQYTRDTLTKIKG